MKIEHNELCINGDLVRKDHGGLRGYIYPLAAHAFSDFSQYFIFGENFFEWPLSFNPKVRAEREWLYQQEIKSRLTKLGNTIDGVRIDAVEFLSIDGPMIEMKRLNGYVSLFELLGQPEVVVNEELLARAIKVYGKWVGLLCRDGIVPECNHCGNVMIDRDNYSRITVIDFENYSGLLVLDEARRSELMRRHRLLDRGVDPIVSLALDIGILSGVKLDLEQKKFYLKYFLAGFCDIYGGVGQLSKLLVDQRIGFLGRVRALFYDATHLAEIKTTGSAVSYFENDYGELCRYLIAGVEEPSA